MVALLAPLYTLAAASDQHNKTLPPQPLVAGFIEAKLSVVSQLHNLLLKLLSDQHAAGTPGVCVCALLYLLQLNLECAPPNSVSYRPLISNNILTMTNKMVRACCSSI